MKGSTLITKILTPAAILLGIVMAAMNLYPSWSQHALTYHQPLLSMLIGSIAFIYLIRSLTHPNSGYTFYWVFTNVRMKHLNRYAAFFFLGIICTPVTHPEPIIGVLHWVFTGLAILFAYLEMWRYYRWSSEPELEKWALASGAVALFGMAGGLWLNLWTVGWGEVIAAVPVGLHVFYTTKKIT